MYFCNVNSHILHRNDFNMLLKLELFAIDVKPLKFFKMSVLTLKKKELKINCKTCKMHFELYHAFDTKIRRLMSYRKNLRYSSALLVLGYFDIRNQYQTRPCGKVLPTMYITIQTFTNTLLSNLNTSFFTVCCITYCTAC